MKLRFALPFVWFFAACKGPSSAQSAPPLAPSARPLGAASTAERQSESTLESALDPASWIQVHAGSALLAVPGTELLRDETGRTWFAARTGVIERTTSGLEPFLAPVRDPSGVERERRLKWVVGDVSGLRYAFIDEAGGPCDAATDSLLLERTDKQWRAVVLNLRDPSPPKPLRDGVFDGGFVLVDSENSCGHGGRPFDYTLVTYRASELWPSPRRFTAPFLFGRRTFSEVSFERFAVTPREEVVVFGLHKGVDASGELTDLGMAIEIFRPLAKASELVPVPDEFGISDFPEITVTSDALMLRSKNALEDVTYKAGHWSASERPTDPNDALFTQLVEALEAHPLLISGAPFTLSEIIHHAGLRWFGGTAGDHAVTFVEGSAKWRHSEPTTNRETAR